MKERGMVRESDLIPGYRVVGFSLSKKLYLVYPAVLIGDLVAWSQLGK